MRPERSAGVQSTIRIAAKLTRRLPTGYGDSSVWMRVPGLFKACTDEATYLDIQYPSNTRMDHPDSLWASILSQVADCVALFSLDQTSAIPVDVHVWRIACRDYEPDLADCR